MLDHVLLSERAVGRWLALAQSLAQHASQQGLPASEIPNEQGTVLSDGSLMLSVEFLQQQHQLLIPPDEWEWDADELH